MTSECVLLYPGQGSQQPGMGKFLYENFKIAQETFHEASDALSLDLKKLCFESSEADLALTENTQPALLCVSTATARVIQSEFKPKIAAAAGHSIGEYAALVSAGVIPFSQAMKAVRLRGQAMQSAVPVGSGGMTAVLGLEDSQIAELCNLAVKNSGFGPVTAANFNSPGQVVISGHKKALEWLSANFKADMLSGDVKRAKLIPLTVSAPFHCAMMLPAEKTMREFLNTISFSQASFPIVQNFTATMESNPEVIKENLIRQVSAPVLWTQSMKTLLDKNLNLSIECGHGKVLNGLLKKIDPERFKVLNTNNLEDLKNIGEHLKALSH